MLLPIFLCLIGLVQVSLAETTTEYTTDLPGCDMAIMKLNYLLTGILVPWILGLFFCIIDCQIHKRFKTSATTMLFQPVQPAPMMVQTVATQQVPMNYGMAQQGQFAAAPGYVGYH